MPGPSEPALTSTCRQPAWRQRTAEIVFRTARCHDGRIRGQVQAAAASNGVSAIESAVLARPEYIPNRIEDPNYVRIFDTTLRDGEQSPGATLTSKEKLDIARQLAKLGVDIIEAGFPVASPDDFDAVRSIALDVGNSVAEDGYVPVICGLSRTVIRWLLQPPSSTLMQVSSQHARATRRTQVASAAPRLWSDVRMHGLLLQGS